MEGHRRELGSGTTAGLFMVSAEEPWRPGAGAPASAQRAGACLSCQPHPGRATQPRAVFSTGIAPLEIFSLRIAVGVLLTESQWWLRVLSLSSRMEEDSSRGMDGETKAL